MLHGVVWRMIWTSDRWPQLRCWRRYAALPASQSGVQRSPLEVAQCKDCCARMQHTSAARVFTLPSSRMRRPSLPRGICVGVDRTAATTAASSCVASDKWRHRNRRTQRQGLTHSTREAAWSDLLSHSLEPSDLIPSRLVRSPISILTPSLLLSVLCSPQSLVSVPCSLLPSSPTHLRSSR